MLATISQKDLNNSIFNIRRNKFVIIHRALHISSYIKWSELYDCSSSYSFILRIVSVKFNGAREGIVKCNLDEFLFRRYGHSRNHYTLAEGNAYRGAHYEFHKL